MGYKFTKPFVVSFGEEQFFLDRDLNAFRDQQDYRVKLLDAGVASEAEVVSACETIAIDFDDPTHIQSRVVVVDNGEKLKSDKSLKAYLERRKADDLSSILAVVIRAKAAPAFWTKLGAKVTLREHPKLKTWDSNNEVVKWVQSEAERIGLNLSGQIASVMYQTAGSDLYRLASELQKLRLLVGPKKPVTIEHLKLVMAPSSATSPWDLVDAVFMKNRRKAMNALSNVYQYSTEDPSLIIMGCFMKLAEQLFVIRSLLDQGNSPDDVAARISMHPYRFKMSLLPKAERQTVKGLLHTMQILSRLDVELKRTSHRRTVVELAVLDLAS
jgi:DNA polymerase III subunit delta